MRIVKEKFTIDIITEYVNPDGKVISNIPICLLVDLYLHFYGSEHGMY